MSERVHSRRVGVIFMLSVVPLAGFAPRAIAQQEMSDVQITATYVAGNVYMLQGRGGNIGVSVGPDGALLVDDQFAPLADKIRAALAGMVEGEIELKFVLNTHWHGDHTGGNVEFGPEAPIIAHANVRKRLAARQETAFGVTEPSAPEALPVITFGDSVSIHFNGEEIRAIHLPHGHTDGDAVVYFTGSNVVHMGDDFFSGRFPFVDLSSGGSVQGLVVAVRSVLEQLPPDVKIIPGHGPLSGREDLRAFLQMLEESLGVVSAGIEAGKGLEELQAAGMPDRWADWGGGFIDSDRWIEILYRSLKGS
jgi:glyoxylase-like metal-dependent hydrolase (beta-lactamase superfamily II)